MANSNYMVGNVGYDSAGQPTGVYGAIDSAQLSRILDQRTNPQPPKPIEITTTTTTKPPTTSELLTLDSKVIANILLEKPDKTRDLAVYNHYYQEVNGTPNVNRDIKLVKTVKTVKQSLYRRILNWFLSIMNKVFK
jgi:hypothetical protein